MFSPSPYPPNNSRRGGTRHATPRIGVGSPLPPGRRSKVGSRLTTPAPATHVPEPSQRDVSMASETDGIASEMSVDADLGGIPRVPSGRHRTGVVFAQSEELTVTLHAHFPTEVQQVIRNADFARDDFMGGVDTPTSFCMISSSQTCFVWKYSHSLTEAPTCYIFPCPSDYPDAYAPFGSLVPYGTSSREPGLLLVSPGGEMKFWDSIGLGLTGGDSTDEGRIDLESGERFTTLINAEAQNYIGTTSNGRLFLFTITSTGGKFHVAHHCFTLSRPSSAISRLRFWGSQGPVYVGRFITAACVCNMQPDRYDVWTCMETSLVKWSVMKEGWEQFDFEEDVAEILSEALQQRFSYLTSETADDLELVDVAFDSADGLVLLTSFAGFQEESILDKRPRRMYAITLINRVEDAFEVTDMRIVPNQIISADRANIRPRLKLLADGELFCVEFGEGISIVSRSSDYKTCLTLQSHQDRTFGCNTAKGSTSELLFMNSNVLMKAGIDMEQVAEFDPETGHGTSIKSIMTQAILFGSNPNNPLLFTLPPDVDEESLVSGAEQLSRAVLTSDIEVVQPNPDLTRQIVERRDLLRFLIGFINEKGGLGKMSQTSRQLLMTDAERLYAAQQLWNLYCQRLNSGSSEQLLAHAVLTFMKDADEDYHDDVMRAFFRLQVRELGALLPFIRTVTRDTLSQWQLTGRAADLITSANAVVLCILQSAWDFRDVNEGVYGLGSVMLNAWTSSEPLPDLLLDFFNMTAEKAIDGSSSNTTAPETTRATRGRAAAPEVNSIFKLGREQLPALAKATFRCFNERLAWLESPMAAEEPGVENEKRNLSERFQQTRPNVLHTLLNSNLAEAAFQLGEEYHDFRSLVDLCHATSPIYPPQDNMHASRIQNFIERFKEEFTNELYDWYIEHGELRCMYAQSDAYQEYLDTYFRQKPQPAISWIHDIGKGQWGEGSAALLAQSAFVNELETKHAILSIGKLAQLTHLTELMASGKELPDDDNIGPFHIGLDNISVHENLIQELKAPLAGTRSRLSLENQIDTVVRARATGLRAYPAFLADFRVNVKALLQGRVLNNEEMSDMLSLKDGSTDYGTALELLKNDQHIPEARRKSAIRSVWRRILIHDDWNNIQQTANTTDEQLIARFRNTALYAAIKDVVSRSAIPVEPAPSTPMSPTGPFRKSLPSATSTAEIPTPTLDDLAPPSADEIASRWPGHSDEELAAVVADYHRECARLKTMLPLEPVVRRIRELVAMEAHDSV